MAISRTKKEEIVRRLRECFTQSHIVAFVRFGGLGVAAVSALRRKLRDAGAEYIVAKKTLARRAMSEMRYVGEQPQLEGEIAFVFGYEDIIAPVRETYAAEKAHKQLVTLLGGVYERAYRGQEAMRTLATTPPREVLLGQIVGLSASPIRGTINVLSEVLRNTVRTLAAVAQSKS